MQQIIDDLKSIPGVVGAAIYRSKHGIIHNNLPSLFKQERLTEIAKLLVKINSAGRLNFPDLAEVLLNFEESVLVCRQYTNQDFLFAICDPGINLNLLSMSLNLAIEQFADQPAAATEPETPATTGAAPSEAPAATDLDKLRSSPALAQPLQVMQDLLTKVMGPMAVIVFEDALVLWSRNHPPAPASLPKLLEILCLEFGDEEKAQTYRELVHGQLANQPRE